MANQQSPIKLVTRTRDKWKNSKPKSIEDNATALAYILWQLALHGAKNLHMEDFRYDSDAQRTGVIEEYLALLVHLSDRLTFDTMEQTERTRFISCLAVATTRHVQRNKEEITGQGDYTQPFLDMLNKRGEEYASCPFSKDELGYQMLRITGSSIQEIMGTDQTNKWVIGQVMDIDGPDLFERLKKSLTNLLGPKST